MIRTRRRIRELPFHQLLPNVLTVLALCAGLTAIRFGFQGRWELAVAAIIGAAVLDSLDGRVARKLGGTTKFGAELDSLSDFLCFGVAPGILVYLWSLHEIGGPGWVLALLYAVCAALRLARFNTRIGMTDLPYWAGNYFTGMAAPAGAGAALLPMMLSFEFGPAVFAHPLLNAVALVGVGALMISRLPTFSFKLIRVPHRWVMPSLLAVGLLAALLATAPWATLSGMIIVYVATVPLAYRSYRRKLMETPAADPAEAEEDGEQRAFAPVSETLDPDAAEARAEEPPRLS
ncbi:MAG: CDP-alcohol phosphatidyltransferase family protein [Alphaproteobacteria bacterium]